LRIELAEAQPTIAKLRQTIAADCAKVIDLPNPLQRRGPN
jgi:hypothetical protein